VAEDRRGVLDHPVRVGERAMAERTHSIQPRRQRKANFTADSFQRHRRMTVPLSRELRGRYHRRNLPLRKGDTVRILTGSYVGREERVAKVDLRAYAVTLDNVTGKTAEAKLKPLPVRPSHLLLIRLNLSDPWRRRILRVSAEEVEEEEPAEEAPVAPSAAPPTETTPEDDEPTAPATEEVPAAGPRPRRRSKPAEGTP
jgi:large subunit ribosomal protein L24